jgi:hypothetical protein
MLTLIVAIMFSCKEEEADTTVKLGLLTKVVKGSYTTTEIQYDESNRPVKMLFYGVTGYPDGYATYEYGDDTLVDKIRIYSQQGVVTSFTTYLYDNMQRLLTKKYYQIQSGKDKLQYSEAFLYNSSSQLINYSEFDSMGNVKYLRENKYDTISDPSEIRYLKPDNTYAGSLYYKYDLKKNAFALYLQKIGTSHPYNKHNISKITSSLTPVNGEVTFNLGTTTIKVALYSSSFEYDYNNLPSKEIRVYLSGKEEIYTFGYK